MRFYVNRHLANLRARGLCRDCKKSSRHYRCLPCARIHADKQAVRDERRRNAAKEAA